MSATAIPTLPSCTPSILSSTMGVPCSSATTIAICHLFLTASAMAAATIFFASARETAFRSRSCAWPVPPISTAQMNPPINSASVLLIRIDMAPPQG